MAKGLTSRPILFALVAVAVILVGTIATMFIPILTISMHPRLDSLKPYTALQLAGRDIYQREGCNNCHTQEIRPLKTEVMRYGEYSKAGEFANDRPFLWGSKRTGPDLHREGGKYPDAWHFNHLDDPRSTSPGSIMPRYPWLLTQKIETNALPSRLAALRKVGVPYPAGYENGDAQKDLQTQAARVVANLKVGSVAGEADREIIALIAYLQRLGTDIKAQAVVAPTSTTTK